MKETSQNFHFRKQKIWTELKSVPVNSAQSKQAVFVIQRWILGNKKDSCSLKSNI